VSPPNPPIWVYLVPGGSEAVDFGAAPTLTTTSTDAAGWGDNSVAQWGDGTNQEWA